MLAVLVVLAQEDDGQLPDGGHVQALVEGPDVAGPVAEAHDGHPVRAVHLGREGEAVRDRDAGTHDAGGDHDARGRMGDVHRAALALARARRLAQELGPQLTHRHTLGEVVVEAAVRRHDLVVGPQVHGIPGRDALLAAGRVVDQRDLAGHEHRAEPLVVLLDERLQLVHPQQHLATRCGRLSHDAPLVPDVIRREYGSATVGQGMTGTLAAIDVGTNSLHLVVARVTGQDRFDVIESEKEMVRLGRGGGDMKVLSDEAMDRGVATLARFRQVADIYEAPVRAVATSATREALNHEVFLERAWAEAGVELEIISGIEEARLIHLGVLQALPVYDVPLLLCDIGGGSTELLLGHRGEVLASRSFKLGAVRLTDRFFTAERTKAADVAACRSYIRSLTVVFAKELEAHGYEIAVGSSGTIESVAQMVHAASGEPPLRTYNGFTFTVEQVSAIVDELASARTVRQRAKVPGLDAGRADIALAGALILEGVVALHGGQGDDVQQLRAP